MFGKYLESEGNHTKLPVHKSVLKKYSLVQILVCSEARHTNRMGLLFKEPKAPTDVVLRHIVQKLYVLAEHNNNARCRFSSILTRLMSPVQIVTE